MFASQIVWAAGPATPEQKSQAMSTLSNIKDVTVYLAKNHKVDMGLTVLSGGLIIWGDKFADRMVNWSASNKLVSTRLAAGDSKYEEFLARRFENVANGLERGGRFVGRGIRNLAIISTLYHTGKIVFYVIKHQNVTEGVRQALSEVGSGDAEVSAATISGHYAEHLDELLAQRSQFDSEELFQAYVSALLEAEDGSLLATALIQQNQ